MTNIVRHVPVLSFIAFVGKSLSNSATPFDIAALVATAVLTAFFFYKDTNKEISDLSKRLFELEGLAKQHKEQISSIHNSVSGLKMGNSLRGVTGNAQNR